MPFSPAKTEKSGRNERRKLGGTNPVRPLSVEGTNRIHSISYLRPSSVTFLTYHEMQGTSFTVLTSIIGSRRERRTERKGGQFIPHGPLHRFLPPFLLSLHRDWLFEKPSHFRLYRLFCPRQPKKKRKTVPKRKGQSNRAIPPPRIPLLSFSFVSKQESGNSQLSPSASVRSDQK